MTAKQLRKKFNYFNKVFFANKLPLVKIYTYKKMWVNDKTSKLSRTYKRGWDPILGVYQHRGDKPYRICITTTQPDVHQLTTLAHEMQHMADYCHRGSTNHGKQFQARVRMMENGIYQEYLKGHIKSINKMSEAFVKLLEINKENRKASLYIKAVKQYNAYVKSVIEMMKSMRQKKMIAQIKFKRIK
jgi:hypothetical protein